MSKPTVLLFALLAVFAVGCFASADAKVHVVYYALLYVQCTYRKFL